MGGGASGALVVGAELSLLLLASSGCFIVGTVDSAHNISVAPTDDLSEIGSDRCDMIGASMQRHTLLAVTACRHSLLRTVCNVRQYLIGALGGMRRDKL